MGKGSGVGWEGGGRGSCIVTVTRVLVMPKLSWVKIVVWWYLEVLKSKLATAEWKIWRQMTLAGTDTS